MYTDFKEFTQSKLFQGILIGIVLSIVALFIFQFGVVIGQHKARFGEQLSQNFERNFVEPKHRNFPSGQILDGQFYPSGYGTVGEVIRVSLPNVIVANRENLEQTVVISDTTRIRKFQDELTPEGITTGDFVVVLGEPNNEGEVEAKLIRLMPPPPNFTKEEREVTE